MRKFFIISILTTIGTLCSGGGCHTFEAKPIGTNCQASLDKSLTPVGQNGEWNLVFSDEFNGPSLDPDKWTTCYWWDDNGCTIASNDEMQWYQPDDVLVDDGLLILRAQKRSINAYKRHTHGYSRFDYTSGMVTTGRDNSNKATPVRFVFQYGYAEIRAKVPRGKGLWPAFWLLPEDHNSKPEIDVMEIYGDHPDTIEMNFHYINSYGRTSKRDSSWTGPDFAAGFHTFAVDWRPDAIIWYVDGIERWRYSDAEYIPDIPMYVLVNLAVGGAGPGAPDASTSFPSYFEIDYVRIWCRATPAD